jgi:type IV secretion system protein VirB6
MSAACPALSGDDGIIRGVLETVSCHSRYYAQSGYEALAAPGSPFQGWLTAFLIIYVAVLGYRLLLGSGSRMSDLPVTALKIGAILALATNWTLFQTLVFDLVWKAPVEIARLVTSSAAAGSSFAGDPVGGLQVAYDTLSASATAFGRMAGPNVNAFADPNLAAAQALRQGAQGLFYTTAGLFCVAMVAAAILTAVGPIFVALFLFDATRGLFIGWVRALLATLVVPLLGWLATALMLMVLEPNLIALTKDRLTGIPNADTAFATAAIVLVFALVQVALTAAGVMIATCFRLGRSRRQIAAPVEFTAMPNAAVQIRREEQSRAEGLAAALNRMQVISVGRQDFTQPLAQRGRTAVAPAPFLGGQTLSSRRPDIRSRHNFGRGGGA